MWQQDAASAPWLELNANLASLGGKTAKIQALPFFIGQSVNGEGEIEIGSDAAHAVINQHDLARQNAELKQGDTISAYGRKFKVGVIVRDRTLGILRCELRPLVGSKANSKASSPIDRSQGYV